MRRIYLILLLAIAGSQSPAQIPAQDIFQLYPNSEAVVQHIEQHCQAPAKLNQSLYYPALLKSPQGYEMMWRAFSDPDSVVLRHTVWSRMLNDYVALPYPAREAGSFGKSFMQLRSDAVMDLNIFYGYRGWAEDVIREFGNKPVLSASERNGLARAYSQKATEVLGDPQGMYRDNPCSPEACDWDEYEKWSKMALDQFETLARTHPGFTTFIGSARLKAENESMYTWLNLRMRGQDDRAKKWLKPALYSEDLRFLAKGVLNSCPQNAILFVEGDATTYPMLYLQETENVRTDVTVVNATLLLIPSYVDYVRKGSARTHRLRMQLPDSLSSDKAPMVFYPGNDTGILIDELGEHFRNKGFEDRVLPGNALRFELDGEEIVILFKDYVMRNVLVIADIIHKESKKRPICFAPGMGRDLTAFHHWLYRDGMVHRLTRRFNTEMDILMPLEEPATAWAHMREALTAFPGESEPGANDIMGDLEFSLIALCAAAASYEEEPKLAREIFLWWYKGMYPRSEPRPASLAMAANTASLIDLGEEAKTIMSDFAAQVKGGQFDESDRQSRLRLNISLDHMINISQRLDDPGLSVRLKWERERLRKLDE